MQLSFQQHLDDLGKGSLFNKLYICLTAMLKQQENRSIEDLLKSNSSQKYGLYLKKKNTQSTHTHKKKIENNEHLILFSAQTYTTSL